MTCGLASASAGLHLSTSESIFTQATGVCRISAGRPDDARTIHDESVPESTACIRYPRKHQLVEHVRCALCTCFPKPWYLPDVSNASAISGDSALLDIRENVSCPYNPVRRPQGEQGEHYLKTPSKGNT